MAICSVSNSFRDFCNNDAETQTFWKGQLRKLSARVPAQARLRDVASSAKSWFGAFLEQKQKKIDTVEQLARYAERKIDAKFPASKEQPEVEQEAMWIRSSTMTTFPSDRGLPTDTFTVTRWVLQWDDSQIKLKSAPRTGVVLFWESADGQCKLQITLGP